MLANLENRLTDAEQKEAELQAKIAELEAQLNSSKQSRKQQTNGNQ
jgi:BMFP domain-containing protein YqiC